MIARAAKDTKVISAQRLRVLRQTWMNRRQALREMTQVMTDSTLKKELSASMRTLEICISELGRTFGGRPRNGPR